MTVLSVGHKKGCESLTRRIIQRPAPFPRLVTLSLCGSKRHGDLLPLGLDWRPTV